MSCLLDLKMKLFTIRIAVVHVDKLVQNDDNMFLVKGLRRQKKYRYLIWIDHKNIAVFWIFCHFIKTIYEHCPIHFYPTNLPTALLPWQMDEETGLLKILDLFI